MASIDCTIARTTRIRQGDDQYRHSDGARGSGSSGGSIPVYVFNVSVVVNSFEASCNSSPNISWMI